MKITGARVATSAATSERIDLELVGDSLEIDLTGHLLLPGLFNAHDHLEFSLFPKLGKGLYRNATEWAADIYRPDESPVCEHRAIPKPVRLMWGGIRNLLSGVTTVSHHNPYDAAVFDDSFPVRVVRDFDWAHSLAFAPDLVERFHARVPGRPFIIHAAEGVDECARSEVRRLDELGILCDDTVLVHAFGLASGDTEILLQHRCSIVWCPRSNLATYGATLSRDVLRSGIPITLGTDSPLTAGGDLRDEIQMAQQHGDLAREEVYRMVTWGSDLVAVTDEGQAPADAIFNLRPEMVLIGGHVRLVSPALDRYAPDTFQSIRVESGGRWLIDADVESLYRQAVAHIGPECRLAGRLVSP